MTVTVLAFLSGTAELGLLGPERPGAEWREGSCCWTLPPSLAFVSGAGRSLGQQQLCFLVLYLHIFTPRISVFGALLGFCLSLLGYFSLLLKSSWGTIRKKHADLTAAQRSSDARGASVRILFNSTLHIFKPCYMSLCGFNMGSDITACSPIPENKA